MKILLVHLLCVVSVIQSKPRLLNSSVKIQYDSNHDSYVEIEEGSVFSIDCQCSAPIDKFTSYIVGHKPSTAWLTPSNGDLEGFDQSDYSQRVSTKVNAVFENVHHLKIDKAKPTDTGLYTCKEAKNSMTQLFIFVKSKSGNVFLTKKWAAQVVDPKNIIISCRSTQLLQPGSVTLYVNNFEISTTERQYDSRYGFLLDASDLEEFTLGRANARCEHIPSGHQWHIMLRAYQGRPELSFETGNSISHEGTPNVEIACVLRNPPVSIGSYELAVTCPRCVDETAVMQRKVIDENKATIFIRINVVTKEDQGLYGCSWYNNSVEQDSTSYFFKVSERLCHVIEDKSPRERSIVVSENSPITLSALATVLHSDQENYSTKWTHKYYRPNLVHCIEERVTTDNTHMVYRTVEQELMLHDTLTIHSASVEHSGEYTLDIDCMGNHQILGWNVSVVREKIKPQLKYHATDGFTVANENFYPVGARLLIECRCPSPDAQIEMKLKRLGSHISIPVDELVTDSGTYESVIVWNTTLEGSLHLYCERNTRSDHEFDEIFINVGDQQPMAVIDNVESAFAHNDDIIYIGDKVTLLCVVPYHPNIIPAWYVNDTSLTDVELVRYEHSRLLYAKIPGTSSVNREVEYTCKIINKAENVVYEHVNVTVQYHEITEPSLNSTNHLLVVKYRESGELQCDMQGAPTPSITWYKDGALLRNDSKDVPLTTRHIVNDGKALQFVQILEEDAGHYVCEGSNPAGRATHDFLVKVIEVPKRYKQAAKFSKSRQTGTPLGITNTEIAYVSLLIFTVLLFCCGCLCFIYLRHRKQLNFKERELTILQRQLAPGISGQAPAEPEPDSQRLLGERVQHIAYNREAEIDGTNLRIGSEDLSSSES